jgi:hypothetical protein
MSANEMAESFLKKCASLPLPGSDQESLQAIAQEIRNGLHSYDACTSVLTIGMRVRVMDDGRFLPVEV